MDRKGQKKQTRNQVHKRGCETTSVNCRAVRVKGTLRKLDLTALPMGNACLFLGCLAGNMPLSSTTLHCTASPHR